MIKLRWQIATMAAITISGIYSLVHGYQTNDMFRTITGSIMVVGGLGAIVAMRRKSLGNLE